MKKLKFIFLSMSLFFYSSYGHVGNLNISLIIPCHFKHVKHLYDLLKYYELQTILPDEVVIAISEIDQVPNHLIDNLKNNKWSFPVKLIFSKEKVYAGENRNKACRLATGDLFVCQDADDLPTPNRLEIIKYFFQTHDIDHLMHRFSFTHEAKRLKLEDIPYSYPKNFGEAWNNIGKFHNGNIAIKRTVFNKIQWTNQPKGQDVEFNQKAYKEFKCLIVLESLSIYRVEYSSWKKILFPYNTFSRIDLV